MTAKRNTIPGADIAQVRREIHELVATLVALALVASSGAFLKQMLEPPAPPLSDEERARIFAKYFPRLPTVRDSAAVIQQRCRSQNLLRGGQSGLGFEVERN